MKIRWLLFLLFPLSLVIGAIALSRDAAEQTVFLERIARQIEGAQSIPPETERAIRKVVANIRWRSSPIDDRLAIRQRLAINRIEARLSGQTGAITRNDPMRAGRDLSGQKPSSTQAMKAAD